MKETDKQNQHQGNYTYIVKCSDETLYTGWTVGKVPSIRRTAARWS